MSLNKLHLPKLQIILIFKYGRLGNQLFQYYGLISLAKSAHIIFIDFSELISAISPSPIRRIFHFDTRSYLLYRILRRLSQILAFLRIIGTVYESSLSPSLVFKPGLLFPIFHANNLYLQWPNIIEQNKHMIPFLPHLPLSNPCSNFLSTLTSEQLANLCFVHVRRGDYLVWPSSSYPAALPKEWFFAAMSRVLDHNPQSIFIIIGDDREYISENFPGYYTFSNGTPPSDLYLMSLCHSGILSPSTFSWWGAFFSSMKNDSRQIYIAPKFWIGHRRSLWYPYEFRSSLLTYI